MPDNTDIERTIFKLEIDGSAYIEGADKLNASTNKLSQAQEAANKKLIELQAQQSAYKKELDAVNAVIKANEKETLELTKRLNDLKAAEKGTSVEAKNLQAQLRGIAANTKEFKIEAATLKTNLTNTTTALKLQTKEVVAAERAQGGFTKSLQGAYTGLSRLANLIPGIGIGGLVALIAGPLVDAVTNWAISLKKVNEEAKRIADVKESLTESASAYTKASVEVNTLRINVELAKKGFIDKKGVVDEYNNSMGKTAGSVKTLDEVEQKLVEHGDAYIQMMLLKAAANYALEKAAKAAFETEEKRRKDAEEFLTTVDKAVSFGSGNVSAPGFVPGLQQQSTQSQIGFEKAQSEKRKQAAIKISEDERHTFEDIAKKFEEDAARISKEHHFNFFEPPPPGKGRTKEIANIYKDELDKLKADIAKLDEKGFTDEATITKAIEADFKKRSNAFEKAFKNKQLTAQQLSSLQGYLKNLQDLILQTQLKAFREQRQAYLQAITDEITNLQIEESTKRIATIQDSFERERQTIISETDKTISALEQKRDKRIADIIKNADKNGLTAADIAPQIEQIKTTYSKLLDDLQVIKNQKLQQLSFETFEKLSEDAKRVLDAENLGISQGGLIRIKQEAELFAQGKISYKEYQKSLTDIAKVEANERFNVEKAFLQAEIKIRQDKLSTDATLTDDQIKRLQDEIRRLQQQLADAEKSNITGNVTDPRKDKRDQLAAYADAIGKVAASVIQFWQAANEAEAKALERSITLQETRVAAAQRIAERGNAEYLRAEEDRLNELNVARENAARKQLGIDAALQASQILVGITGAISKIATPGIGVAETIAEIAVIVGALATGFSLVKSLQGNQPRLFKGTKYLERDGNPSGRDTIPVMANEGEAVIPTDTNKKYHPAISAIYDHSIPAEELNNFVTTYHKIKPVPQVNYERIKEAAESKISHDGRTSFLLSEHTALLKENNALQMQILKKKIHVENNIDRNGVATMVTEYVEKLERDKKL